MVAREIDALRAQVAPDTFAGFDAATFPRTSIPAFGLAAAAYAVDDLTGEVMSLALRDALFERGRTSLTMTYSGRSDSRSASSYSPVRWPSPRYGPIGNGARRGGVQGSPHFFVGDRGWFCPSLDISHDGGRFDIQVAEKTMRDFYAAALG